MIYPKDQTTCTYETTSPTSLRPPVPSMTHMIITQCMSRLNDVGSRINVIDVERKRVYVDLSKLERSCLHLLSKEKAELASWTSELSETRLHLKNDPPIQGISGQRINRGQIKEGDKEGDKEQICANCGNTGHAVRHCVKQEPDGFVHGCPQCNDREHNFDNCIHKSRGDLFFLVILRDGRPPIRTEKDYRDITGFGCMDERPWTPEFSRTHLNHHKTYDYKTKSPERTRIPDPAWLDEDRIPAGSLAYPTTPRDPGYAPHMSQRPTLNGSTNRGEKTLAQDTAHQDWVGSVVSNAALNSVESDGNGVGIAHPKLHKIDTGRKKLWTGCFSGFEYY